MREYSVITYSSPMLMKSHPQNISGHSQQDTVEAFSLTVEVDGLKKRTENDHKMLKMLECNLSEGGCTSLTAHLVVK